MNRLLPAACLILLLVHEAPARAAAESPACGPSVLAALGRELKVAHFVPSPYDFGKDPAGVVIASSCKTMPDDPRLTLAAVVWNAGREDSKALAIAIVDDGAATVVAQRREDIDEDAATQVNNGSVRLDTAPYVFAPGVRAFGVDVFTDDRSCGDGGAGPLRTLYVREGRTLRPVLDGLAINRWRYLRGNQPRCVADQKEAETAILETDDVTIALGDPAGPGGWRDLALTVTSRRSDHHPGRKPLHVRVPCDGRSFSLEAFDKAYDQWRK